MITPMCKEELLKVAREFFNVEKILDITEIVSGHINTTYLLTMKEAQYILQQINVNVFTSPYGMMHNIKEVTEFIRKKLVYEGLDPNRFVLNIVYSVYDQMICIRNDQYWRCFQYIEGTETYERFDDPQLFYEMGIVVGGFQKLLEGFHTRVLDETIRNFHNTPKRYEKFITTVKMNSYKRAEDVQEEIDFIKNRSHKFNYIVDKINSKIFPKRVTHNDTKPSNVLIDKKSNKAICLIDLDTVMKGSLLYDYGDALRIGCSTGYEDEPDLSKVNINLNMFRAFTKGFLEAVKHTITKEEVEGLYQGFFIITCEIAMRFLTDYLDNDKYFKVQYKNHNLVRARNQLKIVTEIEKYENEIHTIINEVLVELEYGKEYLYKV